MGQAANFVVQSVAELETGAFALDASNLAERYGLPVLPVRDKAPLVSKFTTWQRPPSPETVMNWAAQWRDAQLGVVTGRLSRLFVVDMDEPALEDAMLNRFGDTPMVVATSRGRHLYYRWSGERNANRLDGLAVDLRGEGGYVVVPPSKGSSGRPYEFVRGGWCCLQELPAIRPDALRTAYAIAACGVQLRGVREGRRNISLHRALLYHAPACDDFEALLDVARTLADGFDRPLPDDEVARATGSAWRYEIEGHNWVGQRGQVVISATLLERLRTADQALAPVALWLCCLLKAKHGARNKRGEPFAIAARAMDDADVVPFAERTIRRATRLLVEIGELERVHAGGRGEGDVALYRFRLNRI